jgi:hypothetical protein
MPHLPPGYVLPPLAGSSNLTFVPPAVGPIAVNIGAIIIGGKVISPALHVQTPGYTLPPIAFTPGH